MLLLQDTVAGADATLKRFLLPPHSLLFPRERTTLNIPLNPLE